jgi:hypothetical protein
MMERNWFVDRSIVEISYLISNTQMRISSRVKIQHKPYQNMILLANRRKSFAGVKRVYFL